MSSLFITHTFNAEHPVDHSHEISTSQHGLDTRKVYYASLITPTWYTLDRDQTQTYNNASKTSVLNVDNYFIINTDAETDSTKPSLPVVSQQKKHRQKGREGERDGNEEILACGRCTLSRSNCIDASWSRCTRGTGPTWRPYICQQTTPLFPYITTTVDFLTWRPNLLQLQLLVCLEEGERVIGLDDVKAEWKLADHYTLKKLHMLSINQSILIYFRHILTATRSE